VRPDLSIRNTKAERKLEKITLAGITTNRMKVLPVSTKKAITAMKWPGARILRCVRGLSQLPAGRIFFQMVERLNEDIDMRRHVSCHD
jgi:hypothetical protein